MVEIKIFFELSNLWLKVNDTDVLEVTKCVTLVEYLILVLQYER